MGNDLAGGIVEVDLEQSHRLPGVVVAGGRRSELVADDNLHHIGSPGSVGCASAVTNRAHVHRRHWFECIGQCGHQGDAGWSSDLFASVDAERWSIALGEEAGDCRGWIGQFAMSSVNRSAPYRYGAAHDSIDVEYLKSGARADDVDDGIDRADFVEFDIEHRHAMHCAFDRGERIECGERAIANANWQIAPHQQLADHAIWAMPWVVLVIVGVFMTVLVIVGVFMTVLVLMRVIVDHHDGVCSGHSAAQHGFEHQRVIVDA